MSGSKSKNAGTLDRQPVINLYMKQLLRKVQMRKSPHSLEPGISASDRRAQRDERGRGRRLVAELAARFRSMAVLYRWQHDVLRPRYTAFIRDTANIHHYGPAAPKFAERIWVEPTAVLEWSDRGSVWDSARIQSEDWFAASVHPIESDPIVAASEARWVKGSTWEATGEVERMMEVIRIQGSSDGCRTEREIMLRCARLDALFETIARERRIRTRAEISKMAFREFGGIGLHIGPGGRVIRTKQGRHRFAIARILELPIVPARIGVVNRANVDMVHGLRVQRG
jgi:hypothetical protein